jgi:hypothetical protein
MAIHKILITDKESYTVDLPESMTIDDLNAVLFRLNNISKVFSKDIFKIATTMESNGNKITKEKRSYKPRQIKNEGTSVIYNTRDKAIELIKLFYHGTQEQTENFCKKYDLDSTYLSNKIWNIREKRYKIEPQEVGLIRYMNKGDPRNSKAFMDSIKIPGFIFSYPEHINFLE